MVRKNFGSWKNYGSEEILGLKKVVKKKFCWIFFGSKHILGPKKFQVQKKNGVKKNFGFCVRNKFWTPKNVGLKKKNSPPKLFFPQKIFNPKKNQSRKIRPKEKCCPKEFCAPKKFGTQKKWVPKKFVQWLWTAKIKVKDYKSKKMWITKIKLPILVTKFVWLNLVSYSWDTTYMDKCHLESSHLLKIVQGTYL